MAHKLTTNYAKNYCNRTLIVKVIVENVVTFFGTQYIFQKVVQLRCGDIFNKHFITNFLQNVPVKWFENRSIWRIMDKHLQLYIFWPARVY